MDVGTTEIIDEFEEPNRRRSSVSSLMTSGGGGGSRKNRGGDGSDGPGDDEFDDRDTFTAKKSKILAWFVMLVVLMTFGGLLAAYVVISTNKVQEWRPFDLPFQVWISTLIIIASSFTYYIGERATVANIHSRSKQWFLVTAALGGIFIASQILAWFELSRRGFYLQGNPYAGFFYILTAVHAAHVLGGITALGSVLIRSWNPATNALTVERRKTLAQVVGWYWHFMGILWIVLFIFLGFWK
jgi:cytochrome c oxidase subunit 3